MAGERLSFEDYKKQVCAEVCKRLDGVDWFKGVCLDTVKGSWEHDLPIKEAADAAELDTAHWDRPGGLFGDCGDGLGLKEG